MGQGSFLDRFPVSTYLINIGIVEEVAAFYGIQEAQSFDEISDARYLNMSSFFDSLLFPQKQLLHYFQNYFHDGK